MARHVIVAAAIGGVAVAIVGLAIVVAVAAVRPVPLPPAFKGPRVAGIAVIVGHVVLHWFRMGQAP